MTTPAPLFLTTLDHTMLDDTCGMKLWYSKYQDGGGITPRADLLPNEMLKATQADLRAISMMDEKDLNADGVQDLINDVLRGIGEEDRKNVRAMELLYRRLGWMAAWALHIEPLIRKKYLTIDIKEEIELDRNPLIVKVQTGRVLRDRNTKNVEHREFVPTSYVSARWRESWEWSIQPHVTLAAVKEELKLQVNFARVQGLSLGYAQVGENMQLHHPYVYAYCNINTGQWSSGFKYSTEDNGAWKERPLWDAPFSLTSWVLKLGLDEAEKQFPLSPQIPLNYLMLANWASRRLYREKQLTQVRMASQHNKHLRTIQFPQVTSHCTPPNANPCAFKDLCWSENFMADALRQTKFTINMPVSGFVRVAPLPDEGEPDVKIDPKPTLSDLLEEAMKDNSLTVSDLTTN